MVEDVRDEQLAKLYLIIAKKDLEAAELLYKNKFYPQALFYLQQSIEKTAIAVLWHYGIYDDLRQQIARRNGHSGWTSPHNLVRQSFRLLSDGFINFITNLNNINLFGMPADQYLRNVLERYKTYIAADANYIANEIRQIEKDLNDLRLIEKQLVTRSSEFESIIDAVRGVSFLRDRTIRELLREVILSRVEDIAIRIEIPMDRIPLPLVKLMVLGIITEHFATVTRYHIERINMNPTNFNEQNPLVRSWNIFYRTALETLDDVSQLIMR